ncbi:threonine synthase [Paenibacillus sp. IB182496]|uniref:Threonine synthase n=1 Tax=Paenibacillus sabuli TaxID=2772509 RepID=A0A927BSE8_9BACL|nr:threonine synthase [Paenibacillus sabuli]MBD2845061.1 threonine synthase [Paenibacillus sabuli]
MQFKSTRGKVAGKGFVDTLLMGLADDGGLMVPERIPAVTDQTLASWRGLDYISLFLEIFALYVGDDIPREDLRAMAERSYGRFRDPQVTPLVRVKDGLHVLELFHGPTFAFKDVALQFMGELYSYVAQRQGEIIHILGATSGDTGAAAIEGVRGKEGIRICILHPHQKVSRVQELQMTTVDDANVLNLSVKGNFDDCQRVIKELFADLDFKSGHHLRAINSINFLRILAQTVYYFYAYLRLDEQARAGKVDFSVPSGNFGNIFSGYLAKRMGLPVHKLIIATNENNILEQFVKTGVYRSGDFRSTHSPSMDIQVASNFERYLYYLTGEDAVKTAAYMQTFHKDGEIVIEGEELAQVQRDFAALGVGNARCLETIADFKTQHDYLLDPHSACGVAAAEACGGTGETVITFATAHPAKFDEAIKLCEIEQEIPEPIQELFAKSQHQVVVDYDKAFIVRQLEAFYNGVNLVGGTEAHE